MQTKRIATLSMTMTALLLAAAAAAPAGAAQPQDPLAGPQAHADTCVEPVDLPEGSGLPATQPAVRACAGSGQGPPRDATCTGTPLGAAACATGSIDPSAAKPKFVCGWVYIPGFGWVWICGIIILSG